jgi:hypothetical protein
MSKADRRREAKTNSRRDERQRAIERVRRRLASGGRPRLLVSCLLALTGGAGFLVSSALLQLGVTKMSVRYPLAVLLAYAVFLLLLRLWLAFQRRKAESRSSPLDWFPDTGIPHPSDFGISVAGDAAKATFGGAGDFAGGGAGGGWTGGMASAGSNLSGGSSVLDSVPDVPDVGFFDLDLGDGCFWIVIPLAAIAGVVIAMFYVVYVAPVFLAEILVDALLVAGLYKRLQGIEPRHWLLSAVRRTLLPVMLATALFIAAGYLMERIAPEAHSIGGFWRAINSPQK